jgi:hypothetical protein
MDASIKCDILRATPRWRKMGPRYDNVLINGPAGFQFAQVYVFFTIKVASKLNRLALVNVYRTVGRHMSSNYIQLENIEDVKFIFVDTIIRATHILPPSTFQPYYTLQDINAPDIYLRLKDVIF